MDSANFRPDEIVDETVAAKVDRTAEHVARLFVAMHQGVIAGLA